MYPRHGNLCSPRYHSNVPTTCTQDMVIGVPHDIYTLHPRYHSNVPTTWSPHPRHQKCYPRHGQYAQKVFEKICEPCLGCRFDVIGVSSGLSSWVHVLCTYLGCICTCRGYIYHVLGTCRGVHFPILPCLGAHMSWAHVPQDMVLVPQDMTMSWVHVLGPSTFTDGRRDFRHRGRWQKTKDPDPRY